VRTEDAIPRLRGWLHVHAAWVAALLAGVLIVLAPTPAARLAATIYGGAMILLFGASALYHRWRGDARWRPWLRRIDHSAIYVFIAATYTPVGILVLHGTLQTIVLAGAWTGAALGVLMCVAWTSAPRALAAACYAALGWVSAVTIPVLLRELGVAPFVLLAIGGVLYSAGALVYALRRPNLWPRTFGFHEVFHALVVLAAAAQFTAIAGWVVLG
jgi:hemolysin III